MCFKKLYFTKLEKQKEMDNVLDTYRLPKLNIDQKSNLNRPATPSEIKTVIKIFPNKTLGPDGF